MSFRFLLAIVFILAAVFISYFFVWPEYQKTLALQTEIENVKIRIDQDEEYFAYLKQIDEHLEKNKEKLDIIDTILPHEFYLPHLFYALQEIVAKSNLHFQEISASINPLEESTKINRIDISLSVSGSYLDFKKLLSYLEHSVRLFSIEDIKIYPSMLGESFHCDLRIATFYYK